MELYAPTEEGQGLVEYAVVLVLVAMAVVLILGLFGGQISNMFSKVTNAIP